MTWIQRRDGVSHSTNRLPLQGVHMMFEGTPDRKWRADERRVNKMVFIGKELIKEDFAEAFRGCLAVDPGGGALEVVVPEVM